MGEGGRVSVDICVDIGLLWWFLWTVPLYVYIYIWLVYVKKRKIIVQCNPVLHNSCVIAYPFHFVFFCLF